ncbi:AI-2E family transporter [Litorilinea aerophila]|nr:AI-2E family transporter [Litorilinea aerophila]MCC9078713.1 AI-2E family transporter [Litorilinea aerophila]GIV78296.1 MAG: AI-2E family transporter [Litorilinea sp.]
MAEQPSQSPPWSTTTKAIVASVALILLALIIWRFQSLLPPLIMAAILAYLLNPLITWLTSHTRLSRGQSVFLVYGALLLFWIGGGVLLGFVVVDQVVKLSRVLPELIPRLVDQGQAMLQEWSSRTITIGPYQWSLDTVLPGLDWAELANQARSAIQSVVSRGGLLMAQAVQATVNTVGVGFLVFILSIYISNDAPRFAAAISEIAQQPGYRHDVERLMREIGRIWDAYLRGQVLLALVIGIVVSVSLGLLGVSYALGLGVLAGLLEFLPVIGPVTSAVVAVLVALFQGDNYLGLSPVYYGLLVLGVMIVIQQVENNVLVPRIVGDALDLHPLVVMISVLMGTSLAGLLGAVLAAPVTASLKLIGIYAWRKMLDLPPFPEPEPPPPRRQNSLVRWLRVAWRAWRRRLASTHPRV